MPFSLAFTNSEDLRSALGADALGGRFAVLHGDLLGILDLNFLPALHAVGFHNCTSF